jgi:hypothetical protein
MIGTKSCSILQHPQSRAAEILCPTKVVMMMMMIFAKAHCPRQRNTNQTTKKQTDRQAAEKPGFFFVFFKGKENPGIITLTVEAPQQ